MKAITDDKNIGEPSVIYMSKLKHFIGDPSINDYELKQREINNIKNNSGPLVVPLDKLEFRRGRMIMYTYDSPKDIKYCKYNYNVKDDIKEYRVSLYSSKHYFIVDSNLKYSQ